MTNSASLPGFKSYDRKMDQKMKMHTFANTDGIVNCLRQPWPLQSRGEGLWEKHHRHLNNFRYHDHFYNRDNVNRAAGWRAKLA